jgi:hypothetical protein
VIKELNGRPTDVSPTGAAGRESAFIQSYRAELGALSRDGARRRRVRAPNDQVTLHRIVEVIYKRPRREGDALLGSADRSHGNIRGLESATKSLRELGSVRAVAVNADRVDANIDLAAVHRPHLALASHPDRALHRLAASCTYASFRRRETSEPSGM